MPEPYRRLDTAVLEALILKGALGMTEDDISHLDGLGYARTDDEALRARARAATYDAAFFMRADPGRAGPRRSPRPARTCRPKSTYFFPKVPTGLLFNPLRMTAIVARIIDGHEGHRHAARSGPSATTVKVRDAPADASTSPTEHGRRATPGPSPQELLAASLASCTAITMEMYADAQGLGHRRRRGRVRVHARRARLPDPLRARHAPARRASPTSRSSACA